MPSCLKKLVNAYFAPQVSGDGGKRAVPPPTLGAALLGFVRSNFLPLGEFPLVCDPSWCLIILISMAYGPMGDFVLLFLYVMPIMQCFS
jgi:hypothetical protein